MPVIGAPCHTKPRPFPRLAPRLTFGLRATIIVVANVSFSALPPGSGPEGPDQRGEVDVYTIYKETRSSEEPGARERHYAGWVDDQDDAKRRANEIYEGRDSTEAVVVIGNGPTGVEVVYRLDGEN